MKRRVVGVRYYRFLQFLGLSYYSATQWITPCGIGLAFLSHALLNAVAIKLYATFPPLNIFMFGLGTLGFFLVEHVWISTAGRLYEDSRILVLELGNTDQKVMRAVARSCEPLSFSVGDFFKMKGTTCLVYWHFLANNTITLLLLS